MLGKKKKLWSKSTKKSNVEIRNILICTKIILLILKRRSSIQLVQQAAFSGTLHSDRQSVRNINSWVVVLSRKSDTFGPPLPVAYSSSSYSHSFFYPFQTQAVNQLITKKKDDLDKFRKTTNAAVGLQPATKYWVNASYYVGTMLDVHLLNLKYNFVWDFPEY